MTECTFVNDCENDLQSGRTWSIFSRSMAPAPIGAGHYFGGENAAIQRAGALFRFHQIGKRSRTTGKTPDGQSPSEALQINTLATNYYAITALAQAPGRAQSGPEPVLQEPRSGLPAQEPERRSGPPERARQERRYLPAREPVLGRSDCTRREKSRSQARQVLSETSFGNSYAGEIKMPYSGLESPE